MRSVCFFHVYSDALFEKATVVVTVVGTATRLATVGATLLDLVMEAGKVAGMTTTIPPRRSGQALLLARIMVGATRITGEVRIQAATLDRVPLSLFFLPLSHSRHSKRCVGSLRLQPPAQLRWFNW